MIIWLIYSAVTHEQNQDKFYYLHLVLFLLNAIQNIKH